MLNENVPAEKADIGETIDLKKTSGASFAAKNIMKKYRNLARKKPYEKRPVPTSVVEENNNPEDIIDLGDIATLKPNKNAQIAAKKITEKYKDMQQKKKAKTDDVDFTITDSKRLDDDDIDFRVSDSRPVDDTDDIDFTITNSKVITNTKKPSIKKIAAKNIIKKYCNLAKKRPIGGLFANYDDDIDFIVSNSRVADGDIDFSVIDSQVIDDGSDIDFNITDSTVVRNNNAKIAAKKISQKYKNIRAKRKRVESPEPITAEIKKPKLFSEKRNKSAIIAAKKVSDK